ncbi:MAG: NADH-quinone oxidoreductase subunit NuoN [Dongiaceae bacterium]
MQLFLSLALPAIPEIFLCGMSMLLLMYGVFRQDQAFGPVKNFAVIILAITLALVFYTPAPMAAFADMLKMDHFAIFMKILVLAGAIGALLISGAYLRRTQADRMEFPILILFASLGMLLLVSANNLLALYVGLELSSLALYVLAAMQRDHLPSSEAGVKYFVLGALSSGLLLYGISLIYGVTGGIGYTEIAVSLTQIQLSSQILPPSAVIGLVFILAGLAFKISAVPFHMWAPDVYEGAPTPVTAFFAGAPKIAVLALLLRLLTGPFAPVMLQWQQIIFIISVASMALGSFAALQQQNMKRLLAYSSIGHIGFALVGLAAANAAGIEGVMVYGAIYVVMTLGTFACLLTMRRNGAYVEAIVDFQGLGKTHPLLAFALTVFMFSMAGIPPLAGFFAKLYVFLAAIDAGLVALAVLGVLASVVAAYYYLRIIKIMYMEEAKSALDPATDSGLNAVIAVTAAAIIFFIIYNAPLLNWVREAAPSLTY